MSSFRVSKMPPEGRQSGSKRTSNVTPAEMKPIIENFPRKKRSALSWLIFDAFFDLNRCIGMSVWSIAKFIAAKYNVQNKAVRPRVSRCVKSALREGLLEHARGHGMIGSVKLSQKGKEAARGLHVKKSLSKTRQERHGDPNKVQQRESRPEQPHNRQSPQSQQEDKRQSLQQQQLHKQNVHLQPQQQHERHRHPEEEKRHPPPATQQQGVGQQDKLSKEQRRMGQAKPQVPIKNRSRTSVRNSLAPSKNHSKTSVHRGSPVPPKTRSNTSVRRNSRPPLKTRSNSSVRRGPQAPSKIRSNHSIRRGPKAPSKIRSNTRIHRGPKAPSKIRSNNSIRRGSRAPSKLHQKKVGRPRSPSKTLSNNIIRPRNPSKTRVSSSRSSIRGSHAHVKRVPMKARDRRGHCVAKRLQKSRSNNNNSSRKIPAPETTETIPAPLAKKRAKGRKRNSRWDDVVEILNKPRAAKVKASKVIAKLSDDF